jgi:hypothetical protein
MSMSARARALPVVVAVLLALAPFVPTASVGAQVQRGATMTVLRGEVAVVRADGSAIQPAPSGTTVDTGDQIRTLNRAGALITFFAGTEIELGEGTILEIDTVTRDGDRVNVSLKQVAGVTLNRIQTLASGSSYQIDAGGAVAIVRGTTFALAGPMSTSVGNVVALACLEDCTPASTLGGCAMQPFMGIGVVVERGKVASGCQTWAVQANQGYFDAAFEGITTTEQAVTGGNPGQVALGQQVASGKPNESNSRTDRDQAREEDNNPNTSQPAVAAPAGATPTPTQAPAGATPTPTRTTATGPVQACNQQSNSGGAGVTETTHELGRTSGTFRFQYEAFGIPDQFEIFYQGARIYTTAGAVSGNNGAGQLVTYSGISTQVAVRVTGPTGTAWNYTVFCPS